MLALFEYLRMFIKFFKKYRETSRWSQPSDKKHRWWQDKGKGIFSGTILPGKINQPFKYSRGSV